MQYSFIQVLLYFIQTLLSLSKLSLLMLAASGGKGDTGELNSALAHIEYQLALPIVTLEVREPVLV